MICQQCKHELPNHRSNAANELHEACTSLMSAMICVSFGNYGSARLHIERAETNMENASALMWECETVK